MKKLLLGVGLLCLLMCAGCFQWSEDPQGNLRSVGLPGLPVWQSSKPETPLTASMGFTPEEIAKLSKTVLVQPPTPPSIATHYRFYPKGHNQCLSDLQKLLGERAQHNETGPAPYCTDNPTGPHMKGSAMIL